MKLAGTFTLLATLAVAAIAIPHTLERRQCQATLDTARADANNLVNHYYDANAGGFGRGGGILWTDAVTVEDLFNLALGGNFHDWESIADTCLICKMALAGANADAWNGLLNGSNDDALWMVISLWKVGDWKGSNAGNADPYNNGAYTIYDIVAAEWDNGGNCGGGVWWSKKHDYKNAITNELFFHTSAVAYLKTRDQKYLDNANKTWNWLKSSGMRNSDNLWNDGLDFNTCANNGQTTWTYNQGVIASALGALYEAGGRTDPSLLDEAEKTLDAVRAKLTVNGILKESCDDPKAGGAECNHDQQMFKGIFVKHIQLYLDHANDPARTAKYADFLGAQNSAVFHYGTNGNGDIGSVWYAPSEGGSIFTAESSNSGIAALTAAAKYGPC